MYINLTIHSEDLRPLSKDLQRFSKICLKARRTFPNIVQRLTEKILTPPTDGKVEIFMCGGGLMVLEIQAGGGMGT